VAEALNFFFDTTLNLIMVRISDILGKWSTFIHPLNVPCILYSEAGLKKIKTEMWDGTVVTI
jgi:hypothetical protein